MYLNMFSNNITTRKNEIGNRKRVESFLRKLKYIRNSDQLNIMIL